MYATRDRVTACFIWCARFTAFIRVPAAHFIPPRVSGEGTARSAVPPPPCFATATLRVAFLKWTAAKGRRCPLPAPFHCAGADKQMRSRGASSAPEFLPITKRLSGAVESVTSTKQLFSNSPPATKGKAERRKAHRKGRKGTVLYRRTVFHFQRSVRHFCCRETKSQVFGRRPRGIQRCKEKDNGGIHSPFGDAECFTSWHLVRRIRQPRRSKCQYFSCPKVPNHKKRSYSRRRSAKERSRAACACAALR